MRKIAVSLAGLFLMLSAGRGDVRGIPQRSDVDKMKSLLPLSAGDWKAEVPDQVFDRDTIFEYIDGAGEVYRAYNFRRLVSRRFKNDGRPDIILDVFDMGSSFDAYGVFTHDLDGESAKLGQGSNYKGGLLSFWRERYFVAIFAERETAPARQALSAIGNHVSDAIGQDGAKPPLLEILPPGFDLPQSVLYFHSPVILNYHFFISSENILGLDATTDGVLAKAGDKGRDGVLLVIQYPDSGKAEAACRNFLRAYLPDGKEPGPAQGENKKWTAARNLGPHVAIILNAPSDAAAKAVLDKVTKNLKEASTCPSLKSRAGIS